ncbi:hypothetical protein SAMN05518672_10389 [Chitinophaga sp. CF118]|uniref:hypothetical protein n=1 Tax=Chitinophaga sp. CF118 TaxID=1884367 RepID=UPI0008EC79FF|nr:hypothetical protein [Chitinophaga sp. CF118]SFD75679.1 hypothetical protein SAMN05518672_10389 [Chitinophaga sp. CF118]
MKETFRVIHLFSEFTNPFKIVSGAIIIGILTAIVAIVLVILLRKFMLVPRRHQLLKYIAWAYFLLLPALAGFFGFKWGLFNSLRKDIKQHTSIYIQHIPPSFDQQTSAALSAFFIRDSAGVNVAPLASYSTNQLIDSAAEIIYREYYNTLEKQSELKEGGNVLVSFIASVTKGKGVAYFMKKSIRKLLSEKGGLDESVSKDLMATKVEEILRAGLFAKIILIQLDHFLQGVQKGILITFFLIIAIPLVEILIAHYLHRKKLKQQDGKL